MSRRIVGYTPERKAIWEDLGPVKQWLDQRPGHIIGGGPIEAVAPSPAPALPRIRPPKP